jgi:hypothetical protein
MNITKIKSEAEYKAKKKKKEHDGSIRIVFTLPLPLYEDLMVFFNATNAGKRERGWRPIKINDVLEAAIEEHLGLNKKMIELGDYEFNFERHKQ